MTRPSPGRVGEVAAVATVSFTVNDRPVTLAWEQGATLLDLLRDELRLTAAKEGCGGGTCGCCTVLVDGRPALACQKPAAQVAGRAVVTLEGLPERQRRLLAAAFVAEGALQCGFCTPGIVVRAASLLNRGKAGDRAAVHRALAGHLCRCTGYLPIVRALDRAGQAWERGVETLPGGQAAAHGVGTSAPRYRGEAYALGEVPFVADLVVPGMLHAAVVLSEHPRARVRAVHVSEALAMPGVVRVLTAADVPGRRHVGLIVDDWPVLVASGEATRCVGDVLAVVVADSRRRARRATAAIRVDYQVLTPVTDPHAALAPSAPALHEGGNLLEACAFARGDVDAALASSAHVVRQRFTTQRIEHAFLEPEACLAVPGPGGLTVYSQGQGVHDDQRQIAAVLGLPPAAVQVELVATGGAFGGKEDLSIQAHAALAAHLVQRPVSLVLTRADSLRLHPKRHPLIMDYEVGCDGEGRLTAVRARLVGDTGAYASVGGKVLERAAGHCCGPYRVPNVDVEARAVYTNNPPCGAMRGFGVPQTAFAIEGCLDELAARVGIDRFKIRSINVLRPGDRFATGQVMTASCGVAATLEAVRDAFYGARHAGIACGIKNTGIGNGLEDTGRVRLRVLPQGRLEILTGFTEMGQGLFTILRQVVAQETGLDPGCMEVATRSELGVECGMTTASRATALASEAARRAAAALAADLAAAPASALAGREYLGEYVCNFTVPPGTDAVNPITHLTFGYATQVVVLDGDGAIARVVAAHDVGRAINPLACRGQIEGAIHMGLGYALSEDFPCPDGRPAVSGLKDLGILKAGEMPEVEVRLLEVPDEVGGYGAKGVGEIGLVPTAAAVASALRAFDGRPRTALPMRADAPRTLRRR